MILQTKFSRSQVHRGKHHDGWQKEDENKYTKQVIIIFCDPEQNLLFHVLITVIRYQIPKTDTIYAFAIQCQRTNKEIPITWPSHSFPEKKKIFLPIPQLPLFPIKEWLRHVPELQTQPWKTGDRHFCLWLLITVIGLWTTFVKAILEIKEWLQPCSFFLASCLFLPCSKR